MYMEADPNIPSTDTLRERGEGSGKSHRKTEGLLLVVTE